MCTNCGLYGHHNRVCVQPISSYGVIAFSKPLHDIFDITNVQFLLIQRRNSIGFIELVRAKYNLQDIPYIREQISGTTEKERTMLLTYSFYDLWKELWGADCENKHYRNDYLQANNKFEQLLQGYNIDDTHITLRSLMEQEPILWDTPEWEFPKGRRNLYESDEQCAKREFHEETGIPFSQFHLLDTLEPLRHTFYGNNHIHYAHVYYIAYVSSHTTVRFQKENEEMAKEVGNIGWFSYEDAMKRLRDTNPEKKSMLERVYTILQTVLPVPCGISSSSS